MNFKIWLLINEGIINVSENIYAQIANDYFEKLKEYKAFGKIKISTKRYTLINKDKSINIFKDTKFSFLIDDFKKVILDVKYDKFEKDSTYLAYYESQDLYSLNIFKGMEFYGTIFLNLNILEKNYNYITLIQHEIAHFYQQLLGIHTILKSKEKNSKNKPLAGISPLQITKKIMKNNQIDFSGFFKPKDAFETKKEKFIKQGYDEANVIKYLETFKNIKASNNYYKLDRINDEIKGIEHIKNRTNIDSYEKFDELKIFVDYIKQSYKDSNKGRIDHVYRPVEFQTNLISMIGDLQKDYLNKILDGNFKNVKEYEIPDDLYSFTSDGYVKGWKDNTRNDDKILEFFNNKKNKKLFLTSILNKLESSKYSKLKSIKKYDDLYKWYLSNIHKEFINKDIDINYLKLLIKQENLHYSGSQHKKDILIDKITSLKGKKQQKYYAQDIKFYIDTNLYNFKINNVDWYAHNIIKAFYGNNQKKYDEQIKNGRQMDYQKLNTIFNIIKKDKEEFKIRYAQQEDVLNKIYEDYEKFINSFLDNIVKSYERHYETHKNDYNLNRDVTMIDILPKPPTKEDFIKDFNL